MWILIVICRNRVCCCQNFCIDNSNAKTNAIGTIQFNSFHSNTQLYSVLNYISMNMIRRKKRNSKRWRSVWVKCVWIRSVHQWKNEKKRPEKNNIEFYVFIENWNNCFKANTVYMALGCGCGCMRMHMNHIGWTEVFLSEYLQCESLLTEKCICRVLLRKVYCEMTICEHWSIDIQNMLPQSILQLHSNVKAQHDAFTMSTVRASVWKRFANRNLLLLILLHSTAALELLRLCNREIFKLAITMIMANRRRKCYNHWHLCESTVIIIFMHINVDGKINKLEHIHTHFFPSHWIFLLLLSSTDLIKIGVFAAPNQAEMHHKNIFLCSIPNI